MLLMVIYVMANLPSRILVDPIGLEPITSWVQTRCSPNMS